MGGSLKGSPWVFLQIQAYHVINLNTRTPTVSNLVYGEVRKKEDGIFLQIGIVD